MRSASHRQSHLIVRWEWRTGTRKIRSDAQNLMGKRLVGLLIIVGLAAAGFWMYQRYEATKPKTLFPGEATNVVAPRVTEPTEGTAVGRTEPVSPATGKGANSAGMGFQPRSGETLDFSANVPKLN